MNTPTPQQHPDNTLGTLTPQHPVTVCIRGVGGGVGCSDSTSLRKLQAPRSAIHSVAFDYARQMVARSHVNHLHSRLRPAGLNCNATPSLPATSVAANRARQLMTANRDAYGGVGKSSHPLVPHRSGSSFFVCGAPVQNRFPAATRLIPGPPIPPPQPASQIKEKARQP